MKILLVFLVCFVANVMTAGQSLDGGQMQKDVQGGAAECDTKKLGETMCNAVIPGCKLVYKVCQGGTAGERVSLCNAGQGIIRCRQSKIGSPCTGHNQDDLSDEICHTPVTLIEK